jgi:CHAT domain-containing protein
LATLWMVPDEQTRELMGDLIKRWKSGTPAVTALREAQLAAIARLRKEHGFAHPFLWAAFTITGDWR